MAVKEGGGITDPAQNFHLRLAIEKARSVNMPKENIERAIEKAKGEGIAYESVVYEGYGPFGVAMYIEGATDNVNRTVSLVKQALDHAGGSMASPGAVSYLFKKRGVLVIPKRYSFDALMEIALSAGADDIVEKDECFEVYTDPRSLSSVKAACEKKVIVVEEATVGMDPVSTIPLDNEKYRAIEALVEQLESFDDIQNVYTNADILQ